MYHISCYQRYRICYGRNKRTENLLTIRSVLHRRLALEYDRNYELFDNINTLSEEVESNV